MSVPPYILMEIEKLLTQVCVAGLTIFAAMQTRRGIYGHDSEAVQAGVALAAIWALTIVYARLRQGPGAWWLLISAPVVLAMPVTNLVVWVLK